MKKIMAACVLSALVGCAAPQPQCVDNVCSIFKEYPKWYWATQDVEKKWGVPIAVQMAFIHQESRFVAKARPERTKLLWIIPWRRPSTAVGYTQALDETWDDYKVKTHHSSAKRTNFKDAVDFIGWYVNTANRKLHISKNNAYALYLAYHEGMGGYKKKTYLKKPWLIKVAHKVSRRKSIYQRQLQAGRAQLKRRHWWNFS